MLVQRQTAVDQPLSRVIVGKENVVYVDPDARLENGQYFEEFVTNVAAEFDGVTRIDEENVVGFEAREEIKVDLFDSFLNQFDVQIRFDKPGLRIRARCKSAFLFHSHAAPCLAICVEYPPPISTIR